MPCVKLKLKSCQKSKDTVFLKWTKKESKKKRSEMREYAFVISPFVTSSLVIY